MGVKNRGKCFVVVIRELYSNSACTTTNEIASFIRIVVLLLDENYMAIIFNMKQLIKSVPDFIF